jgi:hypothetical protein
VYGGFVHLRDRMAGIDVCLDDLQSGLEASSRAAEALHAESLRLGGIFKQKGDRPPIASLVRHAADLQACALDQREAFQELRNAITAFRDQLKRSNRALRPPPGASAADRHQL